MITYLKQGASGDKLPSLHAVELARRATQTPRRHVLRVPLPKYKGSIQRPHPRRSKGESKKIVYRVISCHIMSYHVTLHDRSTPM